MNKLNCKRGSLTLEAAFVLPLFMFAFLALVMLATTVRAQSTIQYAVDQTAKEISQYYYVINRLGLNHGGDETPEEIETVDEFLENMNTFQSSIADATDYSETQIQTFQDIAETYQNVQNDFASIKSAGEQLYGSFTQIADNPMAIMSSLATMLKSGVENAVICRIIAQPLSKALMPKYITGGSDPNLTLESMGVVDGIEGIDFGLSTFAIDGKTVNVVAVYQIKPLGFSLVDYTYTVKTTGSTAIWGTNVTNADVDDDSSESDESGEAPAETEEEEDTSSPWLDLNSIQLLGNHYQSVVEEQLGSGCRVKKGQGFHFYLDSEQAYPEGAVPSGTFPANSYIKVRAMNIYSSSYQADGGINISSVKSSLKSDANGLNTKVNRVDTSITMNDESHSSKTVPAAEDSDRSKFLIVVLPEDTTDVMKEQLNQVAADIQETTGVTVIYEYKDKALANNNDSQSE